MAEPNYFGDDVALFIDWENFKISLAAGHRTPNLSSLKEEVSNNGRVVVAKAYADWVTRAPELRGASQFLNDPPSLYAAGIEPVFVPTRAPSAGASFNNGVRTTRIKNSVDVKMTADCIECAHSYPNIGTFVLVSGDSDFIHVVNALRTMGKRVIVVGVSWSTSRRLADQVDSLVLYDIDVEPLLPAEPEPLPAVASNGRAATHQAAPDRHDLPEIIRAIEEIVREERQSSNNPLLTSIKQRLMRRYPEFDEKKLGYPGFKKLMARAAQEGNIKLITVGLVDWAIMADEEIPEGAVEESPSGIAARTGRRRGGRHSRSRPRDESAQDDSGHDESEHDDEHPHDESEHDEHDDEHVHDESEQDESAVASVNGAASDAEALTSFDDDFSEPGATFPIPEPPAPFSGDEELAHALVEGLAGLSLPNDPADGNTAEQAYDLIIMADTLEHREGVSHVAFNFLVSEVCDALQQGLDAEDAGITRRWAQSNSKTYVSRVLRGLNDGGFFTKGSHSWREESTGQNKRRRTFNLNRENDLVRQVLTTQWGAAADNGAGPDGEPLEHAASPNSPTGEPDAEQSFISRLFRRS